MALSLSEIEEKAQELAQHLIGTPSRGTADLYRFKLEGLKDLALIMSAADQRAQWNVSVELRNREVATAEAMRERELAAMEQTAANVSASLAKQVQTEPPCPSTFQLSRDEYYVCVLTFQHDGPHTGGGMEWTGPGNGKAAVAVSECAVPSPVTPGLTCQRNPGHPGKHGRAGVFWYEAEPTKPAADQLHELLSYLIQQSELSLDKTKQVIEDSPPWNKHLAASKAYDDAATKLQEILQEGGI